MNCVTISPVSKSFARRTCQQPRTVKAPWTFITEYQTNQCTNNDIIVQLHASGPGQSARNDPQNNRRDSHGETYGSSYDDFTRSVVVDVCELILSLAGR